MAGKIKMPFIGYELIAGAHEGDMFSMGEILGKFGGIVEALIRARYGFLSDEAVKDCKQEMFIVMLMAIRKFDLRK